MLAADAGLCTGSIGLTLECGNRHGLAAAVVAAFPTVVRFLPVLRKPAVRQHRAQGDAGRGRLVIPLGAIGLFFWFYVRLRRDDSRMEPAALCSIVLASAFAARGDLPLNINLTAPHRLYRDQLGAYLHPSQATDERTPIPLAAINPVRLRALPSDQRHRESAVEHARRLARAQERFLPVLESTGAARPRSATGHRGLADGQRAVDFATAMAVSGAAASSYMGLGSMPTLTALLTFLNVRLGFWIRQSGAKPLFQDARASRA